jgi:hypothetical protein
MNLALIFELLSVGTYGYMNLKKKAQHCRMLVLSG